MGPGSAARPDPAQCGALSPSGGRPGPVAVRNSLRAAPEPRGSCHPPGLVLCGMCRGLPQPEDPAPLWAGGCAGPAAGSPGSAAGLLPPLGPVLCGIRCRVPQPGAPAAAAARTSGKAKAPVAGTAPARGRAAGSELPGRHMWSQ